MTCTVDLGVMDWIVMSVGFVACLAVAIAMWVGLIEIAIYDWRAKKCR